MMRAAALKRSVACMGLTAAMLLGLAGSAQGFGTIDRFGQHAEHEQITRRALGGMLDPWTLDELAGVTGLFGAVGAPDRPNRGLLGSAVNHCDGADWYDGDSYPQSKADAQAKLEACRAYIFAQLRAAVADAFALVKVENGDYVVRADQMPATDNECPYTGTRGKAKCNVLEDLGLAFHAAQDFYSHSNWVDQPAPGGIKRDNPPGLGQVTRAAWLDPDLGPSTPFPNGLITGCYDGFPEWANCNYGFFRSRVKHAYLNKDEPDTDRAEINGNFKRAFDAAASDTTAKWTWVESRIRAQYPPAAAEKIVCALRRDSAAACNR